MKLWTEIKKQVSQQYWEYEKLFTESSENQALSEYKSWNHKILLKKEITLKKLSIYQLSLKELQELQDYFNSNLWREYIWYFTSKAEYSVIFIFKKNDK